MLPEIRRERLLRSADASPVWLVSKL